MISIGLSPKEDAKKMSNNLLERLKHLQGNNLIGIVNEYFDYYYLKQDYFLDKDKFRKYLIDAITFYRDEIFLERDGRAPKEITLRLLDIEEQYDKIIYHGRFNPVEHRRQLEQQEKGLEEKGKGVIASTVGMLLDCFKKHK